ncbi:TonB family protein [Olivibacter sp. CPCC 100613]|uniref:TonB family protein n=1 Tax=Olivibacter sp. CPCC 100613 TaxID=3079931 RepID=UPI002FFA391F
MMFLLGTMLSLPGFGQDQIVTYLNKHRHIVAEKDSAQYIRTLTPSKEPNAPYKLLEQYITGEVYRTGRALFFHDRITLVDLVTTFQKDGKRISEEHYKEGAPVGVCRYYYKNGKLKSEIIAPGRTGEGREDLKMDVPPAKLVAFYDSLGMQLVKDGDGYVRDVDDDKDVEEGSYKNGYKDGEWKGTFLKQKYRYTERYKEGDLLEGLSVDSAGTEVPYNKVQEQPVYPDGMPALYRFIGMNYRYPRQAYQQRVNGAVVLSFVVDKEGKLVDIKVVQDLGLGTGEEGIRVLRAAPRWKPGKLRGIPVRVSFTIPIHLNLQG